MGRSNDEEGEDDENDLYSPLPAEVDVYSENLLVAIEDGGEEEEMDDDWLVEMDDA